MRYTLIVGILLLPCLAATAELVVEVDEASVRALPSLDGALLSRLQFGDVVEVGDTVNGWTAGESLGGYVHSRLLITQAEFNELIRHRPELPARFLFMLLTEYLGERNQSKAIETFLRIQVHGTDLDDREHPAVETAAASPSADPAWWTINAREMARLRAAFDDHVAEVEADDGLLAELTSDAPRLHRAIVSLQKEHGSICAQIDATIRAIEEQQSIDGARRAMLDTLVAIARHRQAGSDLVYEAYTVDIGGGD